MAYADLAADVLETLGAMDAVPCVLVGHSMGGKVAMRAALDAPGAVARLAVVDMAPVTYPPRFRGIAAAMAALVPRPGMTREAAEAALAPAVPDPALRRFLLRGLRLNAPLPSWRIGLREIAAALPGIEAWETAPGARYGGPALFVSGANSDYVRSEHRPMIRDLFPRARFVRVKHAGHWVHADNLEGFVAALSAFLAA